MTVLMAIDARFVTPLFVTVTSLVENLADDPPRPVLVDVEPQDDLAEVGLEEGVADLGPEHGEVVGADHRARPQRDVVPAGA